MKSTENDEVHDALVRSSLFNEFLGAVDGRWVIYNNLSEAMIGVNEELYNSIITSQLTSLSAKNILTLKQAKFLIENNHDEAQEIRDNKKRIQENHEVIGLQILPTMSCNFKCSYCFEKNEHSMEFMPTSVMDHIISWVVKKLKPTTKVLNTTWFGGEPLLAIPQIQYLSGAFLDITRANNLTYYSTIVTNGYLLTEKNIDILLDNRIHACTVTIDGPDSIHDQRRILKNGGGTWRTIINNVKLAIAKGLGVTIRVNIDKTNCDSIDLLLSAFAQEKLLDKVGFSFGNVGYFGQVCASVEDQVLSAEESVKIFEQESIKNILSSSKSNLSLVPPDFVGCVATSSNSYIVGPMGELYKCTKSIGTLHESCGNIADPDVLHPNFIKWINQHNFDSIYCSDCSLFPICRGQHCAHAKLFDGSKNEDCSVKMDKRNYHERLLNIYKKKLPGQIQN